MGKKQIQLFKNKTKSGMTLIEAIVAFSIIAIIIVVAVSGMNTIASVDVKSQNINKADENIELLISQNAPGSDSENVRFSFMANGETYMIEGIFRTYEDALDGASITVFIPK